LADRAALPLPTAIEEIDREWLTAALRTRAPDTAVEAFEIVDVMHGTCTKVRLRLELNEAGRRAGIPQMVILKGGFEPHSRGMASMHESEVRGYATVLPALELPSPACCFAAYDAERRQGIVIMEDLVARGVAFCSALRPQSYAEVARRLTTLARFHARTWDSPDGLAASQWGFLEEYMAATRSYADYFLQPEVWGPYVDSPRGAAASVRFHDPAWTRDALDRLVVLAGRSRAHCVLHGDTHLGNLYVDPDGTPGFFDMLAHRGPAIAEVSYHVVCALDPADRRRWETALVAHYLEALARNGVEPPDLDEAMRDYDACLARAYFIFLINDSAFQHEAINTAYVARISAAMLERDTLARLRAIT
jgi:hypothetical protein